MSQSISMNVKIQQYVNPQSQAAATYQGAGVDTSGFNTAQFMINLGTLTVSGTFDAKVQESDDNSAWTDGTGAAIPQVPDSGDETLYIIELRSLLGNKKFLRVEYVTVGAATLVGMSVLLGRPHGIQAAPVQVPTVAV